MKHIIKNIHFVGIGGAGMSGIAEVLHTLGYCVSGSDQQHSTTVTRLKKLGIHIEIGHDAKNIDSAQVLVTSSAIDSSNPEVQAARQKNIPIVPRALMLAELMRFKKGIAVAGTHGKTTTTSLVTSILAKAGLDPTFVIGGKLNQAGVNARLGSGEFLVAEADESDASFLHLNPVMQIITNINADHMSTYEHNFAKLKQAFINFAHNMPFYGQLIACIDDPYVCEILPFVSRTVISYGIDEKAMYRASNIVAGTHEKAGKMYFKLHRPDMVDIEIELNLAGLHNVKNALAAIAIATELDIPDQAIQQALAEFSGVGRRFQRYQFHNQHKETFLLIDDYGHHPNELQATLNATKGAYPDQKITLLFQPHRYSRTRDCFEDFVKILLQADQVILTEVYAAHEEPIAAADAKALARSMRLHGKEPLFVENVSDIPAFLKQMIRKNEVVLSMGAGSIGGVVNALEQLENLEQLES
jgi:UDP-N-acetylmuramate--alanine ligase